MKALWLLIKNLSSPSIGPRLCRRLVPLNWFERHPQWPDVWAWPQFAGAVLFGLGAIVFLHCQWLFAVRGQGTPRD